MNAKTITSTDMWSPDLVGRTDLVLGSRVRCCDGPAGTLTRIVLDPVSGAVTHLVVLGRAGQRTLRLVPIHLVESAGDDIWLHCDRSAFEALEVAEGREYVPASDDGRRMDADWGLHEPFYWLGGAGMAGLGGMRVRPVRSPIPVENIPAGDVAIDHGARVHATDGVVGRVTGIVLDPDDEHVTYLLVGRGHPGARRRAAVPYAAVVTVDDGVRLSLTSEQVSALPALVAVSP
jgi:sporulation protein YlmC with PRC-barrel domain